MTALEEQLRRDLQRIDAQGLHRSLTPLSFPGGAEIVVAGKTYCNLAGNDYLGLATDLPLVQIFYAQCDRDNILREYGPGSGASRLMTGNHQLYSDVEKQLAQFYGTQSALIFNSGYHINIGLLPALAGRQDLILADKFCHASLIDGMRLSRARVIRYPHLDYSRLRELLAQHRKSYRSVFLVTESIFSMDGDCVDLTELVRLKNDFAATLYVDEAHAVGMRGQQGRGLAEEQGVLADIDLFVGTFGKAYASQGAFIVCSETIADYLVNTARSLIFTTGLPPVTLSWLRYLLQRIPHLQEKRVKVHILSTKMRGALWSRGLNTGGESNIIPVMIGKAGDAVRVAESLRENGYWLHAIRPPTVPSGTARLRLSLTAAMEWDQLAPLAGHIAQAIV